MPSGSALVPGYPALNKPFTTLVSQGGAISVPVTATAEGFATATVALGGTLTNGNTLTVTLNGHGVTYTVVSGDSTLTLLATHLAAAINADSTDTAIVTAAGSTTNVTLTAKTAGTVGEYSLTVSKSGGATETIVASSPTLVLGAGTEIVPLSTFVWQFTNQSQGSTESFTFYKGFPYTVDAATATAMRSAGFAT